MRGNGTGPFGRVPGMGRRRMGAGAIGNCICPKCKTRLPHQPGTPCSTMVCPKCGTPMMRE